MNSCVPVWPRLVGELASAERAARQANRDRDMQARFEQIRLLQTTVKDGRFDVIRADPAYEAAFREYGIDVTRLDDAAVIPLMRQIPIAVELAAALVDWSELRRGRYGSNDPLGLRLLALAQAADADPWRQSFREALRERCRPACACWSIGSTPAANRPRLWRPSPTPCTTTATWRRLCASTGWRWRLPRRLLAEPQSRHGAWRPQPARR